MRPRSIPEFTERMNSLFSMTRGNKFLDASLMIATGRIELDILALDDYLHEKHGEYEAKGMSMSECIKKEYGTIANAFVEEMIG